VAISSAFRSASLGSEQLPIQGTALRSLIWPLTECHGEKVILCVCSPICVDGVSRQVTIFLHLKIGLRPSKHNHKKETYHSETGLYSSYYKIGSEHLSFWQQEIITTMLHRSARCLRTVQSIGPASVQASSTFHLRTGTDPVDKTLCSLAKDAIYKVHTPMNPKCNYHREYTSEFSTCLLRCPS